MTSSRSRRLVAAAGLIAGLALGARGVEAELPEWVRNVAVPGPYREAIFRDVTMPGGPVEVRRPPGDARAALLKLPSSDTDLLALRARAAEEALDFQAAEADWKTSASLSKDVAAGQLTLADFYHRRLMPPQEAEALAAAAQAPDPPGDRLVPIAERRSSRIFERLFALIEAQQLPDTLAEAQYRAWIARHRDDRRPYDRLFRVLAAAGRAADAEAVIAEYQQAFPGDEAWRLRARAELATRRGAPADALAIYDGAFQPLWDPDLLRGYFELLDRTHMLRTFLERARADATARPDDIAPVARIFHYYVRTENVAAAERALADFESRRSRATRGAAELFTLARLYQQIRNYNEALRYYAALYSLPGAPAADVEAALAGIIDALFTAPEQALRFGSGDLSFYRDIATLDTSPGLLNGVLSLLFNSASPSYRYAQQEASAVSYFHRARAADLLALFETRFPGSPRRAGFRATLIATYAAYGESDAVLERGRQFLEAFPDAAERTTVMLAMADALGRKAQIGEELAIYDRLLQELAARAERVPLGSVAVPSSDDTPRARTGARSLEYARVLDRYIARLVAQKRLPDAFGVYRREIERNPDDPGLYAAAAQFLDQNDFNAEVEQIYRLAIQQFPDPSWHHRLARWYLRHRREDGFETLTRDVIQRFEGTELARYFTDVSANGGNVSAQLFLQLNLFAHERFPHHLTFVRNLLLAYSAPATRNAAAYDALLRRHWFEDENLRTQFLAGLSRANRLDAEIDEIRRANAATADPGRLSAENPAAARFLAEGEIWRSRFESATPTLSALAAGFPGDVELGHRAAMLHRSLSYADARETDRAAEAEQRLLRYSPRDVSTLTTIGEIYADRGLFDRARREWDRIPDIEPGRAAGYLDAATVFWDYYQFDDALRLIALGRTRLKNPALHAYEAGAVYENLRRYEQAIDEYVRGALASGDSPALSRLLTLARRPAYRELVDRASAAAVGQPGASGAGITAETARISLRIEVLTAQERRPDLERFLTDVLTRTSSFELLATVGSAADRLGFEGVRTQALTRQIEVMTDPVEKVRLRYAMVALHEARGELAEARQALDAIYRDNPRLAGVVRQTVDYYWRRNLRREAIDVLKRAAAESYPALRTQFTFEAARKATELGDYPAARDLLNTLIGADRFNASYLAAMAETYALARDDRALRDFYVSTIDALRQAPLAADERTTRIAGMRRALIPALTRLGDYAGAVDQYIEVVNRFPDDDALLSEAGRYARQRGRAPQIVAYYTKTAADAPRDYRWPMLLAKLQAQFDDFPAAIAAYTAAIAIRPDRADFYTARASLEERVLRFDAAVESYAKAYELTYRAPQWMERIAELRARQGQVDATVRALRTALIEGRPERAEPFFAVARRLEDWDMLAAARPFVEEGARLAGDDGLLDLGSEYVSVRTRLREANATLDRLLAARGAARAALRPGAEGAGIDFRLSQRLQQMGDVIARDFAPEEKTAFAAYLDQRRPGLSRTDVEGFLVPLAERAGLAELAVRWHAELMTGAPSPDAADPHRSRLVALQSDRLQFAELGQQLEAYAPKAGNRAAAVWHEAAAAYEKAGDSTSELRVLSRVPVGQLSPPARDRFFALLLSRDAPRLTALAATGNPAIRDAAANYVVAHGTADQALAVVQSRSRGLPPVWPKAYSALVGLHFGRFDPATTVAFTSILGPMTVGDQLKPVDRTQRLAGDDWFAYGSRFGEYLAFAKQPGGADYLPSEIERAPARSDAYVMLADFYRDTSAYASALAEYDRGAALNPRRSDVHMRAAAILWRQGQRAAAAERWVQAMQVLTMQARGRVDPEAVSGALDSIGSRQLWPQVREPADRMVRAMVASNGTYRTDGVLRSAFRAANDPVAATDWLLDVARAAPNPVDVLAAIAAASWLPDAQRDRFYDRIVTTSEEAVSRRFGTAQSVAQGELDRWRVQRIRSLADTRQSVRAAELLRALPERARMAHPAEVMVLETRVAAAERTLDALLDRYGREDTHSLALEPLREAATALRRVGDRGSSQRIMELVYSRELDRDGRAAPAVLGLAEIRLEQGNVPAALDLLRRLTLASGAPFEHHAAAGALLARLKRPADALEFYRVRAQAVPWDESAQIAFARAALTTAGDRASAIDKLTQVTEATAAPYAARVEAARVLGAAGAPLGRPARSELEVIRTASDLTPATTDAQMFVDARLVAAERTAVPAARLAALRPAVATAPERLDLRVPLFRASLAAGRPADAIQALAPLLRRNRSLADAGTPAERTRLARELGDAYERVDELSEAVRYLTIARDGQTAVVRATLTQRIASLDAEIARRATNAARRPEIHESLDQPRLVRPLIPPRRAATVATVAAGARP